MTANRLALLATAAIAAAVIVAPARADDTITIGFTVSQTGPLNNDSVSQMRGFELWRDEVNAAGGIKAGDKHYKINFTSYDDESQNVRVQQLYTRLIAQDKAQFLFSPYSCLDVFPTSRLCLLWVAIPPILCPHASDVLVVFLLYAFLYSSQFFFHI